MQSLPTPLDAGTVIVGMSGGVDSAVAALLLKEAGFTVQGLFMSNWEEDGYCTAALDWQDARRVCDVLDIPLHRAGFAAEYRERVFAHFLREYAAGRTPNPDVLCNREIKFGVCLTYMQRLGASWIATGHYARVRRDGSSTRLLKAHDLTKDQSYFLHQVDPAALARTLFPIGHLRKDAVRDLAHAAGLPVFDKPDSTGICFIGERPFAEFLGRYLRQASGPIESAEGELLGEHRGLALYTLGQRSGLRIGGRAGAAAAPWYVAGKDTLRNTLLVVQNPDHPLLLSDSLDVEDVRWLGAPPGEAMECSVKTRYRQSDLACTLRIPSVAAGSHGTRDAYQRHPAVGAIQAHGAAAATPASAGVCSRGAAVQVSLHTPARAVTPGQYAVFYRGDECLGGGVIAARRNSRLAPLSRAPLRV
jgi:tRNA-specific 2-thiouridylase